mmetsp:Transcript_5856/g.13895  ORF Transcript_5856/g.13895 Transcript_5856/m.13895 type:complete len:119 (+) Transcript_5856:1-357(+)
MQAASASGEHRFGLHYRFMQAASASGEHRFGLHYRFMQAASASGEHPFRLHYRFSVDIIVFSEGKSRDMDKATLRRRTAANASAESPPQNSWHMARNRVGNKGGRSLSHAIVYLSQSN